MDDATEVDAMIASYVAGGLTALRCTTPVGRYPALFTRALRAYRAAFQRRVAQLAAASQRSPAVVAAGLESCYQRQRDRLAARIAARVQPALLAAAAVG